MTMIYLQTNLMLVAAWIVQKLLSRGKTSFHLLKIASQGLFLIGLMSPLLLHMFPEKIFWPIARSQSHISVPEDIDGDAVASFPVHRILQKAAVKLDEQSRSVSDFRPIFWGLFFFGLLISIVRCLLNWIQLQRVLRESFTLHRIGRVSVMVSDSVAVPFSALVGRRAFIVLPNHLLCSKSDFRIAIRHEVQHHRAHDTLWAQLIEIIICGFYLNPAIYAWKKSVLELQELACDEALISRMGISAYEYGSCLLRVAEMALGSSIIHAGTTCMIPDADQRGRSFLRRRIEMFTQHQKSRHGKTVAIITGTLASLIVGIGAIGAHATFDTDYLASSGKPAFDGAIQKIASVSLKEALSKAKAGAGFVLVSEAATGKLLAAVSLNESMGPQFTGDWALSYRLQPASAMKSIVLAAALQEKSTSPSEMHDCSDGKFPQESPHGVESATRLSTADAIVHSSNMCTIKIAEKIGASGLEKAFLSFGFGHGGSAEDFPSARSGLVPSADLIPSVNYISLAAMGSSSGSDFYVTPIEIVQAYGAIANGGRLMKPVPANASSSDTKMVRQVLSPDVAGQVRRILRQVVTEGTARSIRESSYPLAGKTSTYSEKGLKIAGFVGFAPADNPKVVVYVGVINPGVKNAVGSSTAGPAFREIVEKILVHLGI